MLNAIRKRSGGWVVRILLVLLAGSFAVWGINDVFRDNSANGPVAVVGEIEISPAAFDEALRSEITRLQPLFGGRLDRAQAEQAGIADLVLKQMITGALFDMEARRLGITVSDNLVRREIARAPVFRNPSGVFDSEIFRQVLFNNRLTEERYVTSLRRDLSRAQLTGSIAAGTTVPTALLDLANRYRNEQRVAEIIHVPLPTKTATPDSAAVEAYYQANLASFVAPEYRKLAAIRLDAQILAPEIKIAEVDIRQAYEDRIDEFRVPETRNVDQLVFASRDKAVEARELIDQGQSLAAAGKQVLGPDSGPTSVGWLTRDNVIPELSEPIFALADKAVSAPVESPLGWHILRVNEIKPEQVRSFAEAREALAAELARDKAVDTLYRLSTELEDALAGGATLEEAAKLLNVKLQLAGPVDVNGLTPDGLPGLDEAFTRDMVDIAFNMDARAESALQETSDGGFFVLRVDEIIEPRQKTLAEIRKDVIAAIKTETRHKAAEARVEKILTRLQAGEPASKVAAAEKLTIETSPPFTRSSDEGSVPLPDDLRATLFTLKIGQAAHTAEESGYVVARLAAITPPDTSTDAKALAELRRGLERDITDDLLTQFSAALRARYTVTVNRQVLTSILAP